MKYDVIIIGAGLGGLECALDLSKAGRSVLVLEREVQAGGCLQSYPRRGLSFDTGLHYVGGLDEGQVLHDHFERLGLLELPWHRLDPQGYDQITIAGETFCYSQGYDQFVETLAQRFPQERQGLERLMGLFQACGEHILHASSHRPTGQDFLTQTLMGTSAYDYLHSIIHDPLLINVLCGSSIKLELDKETLPLYAFAQINNGFVQSAWRLEGDGNMIVDRLIEQIRANGGEVLTRCGVEELIERDGRIAAARCENGEIYEADVFISNAHPAVTVDLVKESQKMRKIYKNRIRRMANQYGMFTVSLALKPDCLPYFNHNKFIYREANVWDFWRDASQPVSGVMVSCRKNSSTFTRNIDLLTPVPEGLMTQWNDTTIGHRGEEYKALKQRLADECIALAETQIPGLRDMIDFTTSSSPLTYRDYTLTPEGSAYGLRKDWRDPQMTILPVRTPIDNLLLTGQNLTLHGVLGTTMSAMFTCREVMS